VVTAEAAMGPEVAVQERSRVPEGAAIGAGAGGAAAALAAGLTSVGAIATGGAGLLAAGPLIAALAGAGAGAAGGGLLGTLIGMGLTEEEAKILDEEIREGGLLVTVEPQSDAPDPKPIFARNSAKRVFNRGG